MINVPFPFESLPFMCPRELFENFRQHLRDVRTTSGLVECVLDASNIGYDDVDRALVAQRFEQWAEEIRRRCRSGYHRSLVAHLHELLFVEEGFRGCDFRHYEHPSNSFLGFVLESKRGLPILLSLVYKVLAEKVGLTVHGIATPGRFLIRVHDGESWMIVDPFSGGRILSISEVHQLIREITGAEFACPADQLPVATHFDWIERIVTNLVHAFDKHGCHADRDAMYELIYLVRSSQQ